MHHGGGYVVADEAGRYKLNLKVDHTRAKCRAFDIHADCLLCRVLWVCPVGGGDFEEAHIFIVPARDRLASL